MSTVTITPSHLFGQVTVPSSKSIAHRLIIAAALSERAAVISNIAVSEDISATIDGVRALGASCEFIGDDRLIVHPVCREKKGGIIDCRESASTLRFIIPIAISLYRSGTFTGSNRLLERPLEEYMKIFEFCKKDDTIKFFGQIDSGTYILSGDISSQYITGMMFALSITPGESKISITPPFNSRPYALLTEDILKLAGVKIKSDDKSFIINGMPSLSLPDTSVEVDWTQAAIYLALGAMGGEIECAGLSLDSCQGDKAILDILSLCGADISVKNGLISAVPDLGGLNSFNYDASQTPDLVPILAVLGSAAKGTTTITGVSRLRFKESDRAFGITEELSKLGADISLRGDIITVRGLKTLRGGVVSARGDHRIGMALSAAAYKCENGVTIEGYDCVSKSYPNFFEHLKSLNAKLVFGGAK